MVQIETAGFVPPPSTDVQFSSDWNWRNTGAVNPGDVRTNPAGSFTGATQILLSKTDRSNKDQSQLLTGVAVNDMLEIHVSGNPDIWVSYLVTATASDSMVFTYTVIIQGGAGTFPTSGALTVSQYVKVAPAIPTVDVHIEMNHALSLEAYDVFLTRLKEFISLYAHMIVEATYETTAPEIYTIPVLVGVYSGEPQPKVRDAIVQGLGSGYRVTFPLLEQMDAAGVASKIPDPRRQPVIIAPEGQTSVVSMTETTAGLEDQAKGV